jgi:hypothetical protein
MINGTALWKAEPRHRPRPRPGAIVRGDASGLLQRRAAWRKERRIGQRVVPPRRGRTCMTAAVVGSSSSSSSSRRRRCSLSGFLEKKLHPHLGERLDEENEKSKKKASNVLAQPARGRGATYLSLIRFFQLGRLALIGPPAEE